MAPVRYQTTGGYDADTEVRIDADGAYTVEGGGYRTRGRRSGRLTARQRAEIGPLAAAAPLRDWPVPDGADGFVHTLRVGDRTARWWGPPADVDDGLARLVRALTTL